MQRNLEVFNRFLKSPLLKICVYLYDIVCMLIIYILRSQMMMMDDVDDG